MKALIIYFSVFCSGLISINLLALNLDDFFQEENIQALKMSPDGKYLAYGIELPSTEKFVILDLDTKEVTYTFEMGEDRFISSWNWANNERIVLQAIEKHARFEAFYSTGALQAFNFDGSKNVKLWGFDQGFLSNGDNDKNGAFWIEKFNYHDPENIYLTASRGSDLPRRLFKMDIYNGKIHSEDMSRVPSARYYVDDNGEPVIQIGRNEDNNYLITYYTDGNGDWQLFTEFEPESYRPIDVTDNNKILFEHRKDNNVTDIVEFDRSTKSMRVVESVQNVEPSSYLFDASSNMVGYRLDYKKPEHVFFDESSERAVLYQQLKKAFPNLYARIVDESEDGKRKLIFVSGDKEPGIYYFYDETQKLSKLIQIDSAINRQELSPTYPVSFKARDGQAVSALMTVPATGSSPNPMVVLVHGGPFGVRDYWGFDTEAQILASRFDLVDIINGRIFS